ncbi:RDD family protein [Sulfuriferula thiophila]|uniref:RDD family protein n=1 Tax=Sulfuriferula thiophila TaxID=1781211 RepID=UPI000F60566E|nr:RDD family protein [Sulfuriferula thiophila]
MNTPLPTAGIWKRFATMIYEIFLLAAVVFISAGIFYYLAYLTHNTVDVITHTSQSPLFNALLDIYIIVIMATYFSWFWMRGQSLAMKTWHIHVVKVNGEKLDLRTALIRFAFSWLIGITQIWAFFDRDGQFLHDRLAGTRLVTDEKPA